MTIEERILENLAQDVRSLRSDSLSRLSTLTAKVDVIGSRTEDLATEIKALKDWRERVDKERHQQSGFDQAKETSRARMTTYIVALATLSSAVAGAVASVMQFFFMGSGG